MPSLSISASAGLPYCSEPFGYRRRKTRVIRIGRVAVGGDNPIRVQSMTTTDTQDVKATVLQTQRMVQAGCEIVRITAPTVDDARALGRIKAELMRRGSDVPLVADIHFNPSAALEAAEHVEKVRVNPGNFADSKRFLQRDYTDGEYEEEVLRIEERFSPLVAKLKRLGRALRVGTNHGSLSDRIMNRYGDTPLGMVESALEFVRICAKNGYHDVILSMKASNPKVMIAAYRLLAARLDGLGMDYPFHLGVTEAGDGEDGRIKSAIGIGSLLEDGIGDTIRVSLTEDPEREIPVCRALLRRYDRRSPEESPRDDVGHSFDPFSYSRRPSRELRLGPFPAGGREPVRVFASVPEGTAPADLLAILERRLRRSEAAPEILEWHLCGPEDLRALREARRTLGSETSRLAFLVSFEGSLDLVREGLEYADLACWTPGLTVDYPAFLKLLAGRSLTQLVRAQGAEAALAAESLSADAGVPSLFALAGGDVGRLLKDYRLLAASGAFPIHLQAPAQGDRDGTVLESALLIGGLLADGIGDSVSVSAGEGLERDLQLSYDILQGAGLRLTKTEFVSCPSCGRTLFDLQTTTERIKRQTGHLKGVKIAIMGCIVNGPGEMADADFGYVGGAPDRINLYVGKECVKKGVPTEYADQALIDLIKSHGKWVEPPPA